MTSIFDQYEASMSRVPNRTAPSSSRNVSEPISSGIINTRLEDDTPIFSKSKINFKPSEPISHLSICNNVLCMIMSGKILTRINFQSPDDADEIEITRGDEKVYKIFFDPTGEFLLANLTSEETLFLSSNSRKPKSLNKLKGHKIESVAWCRTASGPSTGPVLVGSSRGLIIECSMEAGDESKFFGGSVDQYFKQVYNFAKGEGKNSPVLGLEYFCTSKRDNGKNEYCIFVITPSRLLQFSGTVNINSGDVPVFGSVFAAYQKSQPRIIDLQGHIDNSQLKLSYDPKNSSDMPSKFAWLAAPGIYIGDIKSTRVTDESALLQRSVITNARLLAYPEASNDLTNPFADPDETDKVLSVILTDFHVLLLYSDRIKILCVLNEQIIFEDVYLPRYGQLLGLLKDPVHRTIWAYTDKAVFRYKIVRESRDVWQMYLDMGKFDLAREYCRENPANLNKVLTRQAETVFEDGKYHESAMYYAITQNSFEDIALKFIRKGQEGALRTFLQKKITSLKPGDLIQITMLSTWLAELHLNHLGKLKENGASQGGEELKKAKENFQKFLAQEKLKESFQQNRSTIYNLLISHGDIEDYIFFAVLMKDYERVVNHHIQNEDYEAALRALKKQNDISLYYKFSPILMQHIPTSTVDAWIQLGVRLEPRQLIPSLVNCTQTSLNHDTQWKEAIRYLEHAITELNCTEQAIHNYLLSLYVKHLPESIHGYLKSQGDDGSSVCYDVKYALRLCLGDDTDKTKSINSYMRKSLQRACVHIYTVLKLYEEAVSMALKVDVELAKSIADRRELEDEDEELKKKLWLQIAKHVVQEDKNIKRAMDFLQESRDLLKIEDILPFFPDFVTIDHFKDALCESLAEYNKQIDRLKEEMSDATASAHAIRTNIHETKNRHLVVGDTERCSSCDKQLLTRAFYIFPCQHAFHSDCLYREVRVLLSDAQRVEADKLQQELMLLSQTQAPTSEEGLRQRKMTRQKLILQLDEVIATECVLCGEIAVKTVDKPFYDAIDAGGWL